jgi:glyoxylase-like metal-dependent hydrolase (beta-lactamase superfamily II)
VKELPAIQLCFKGTSAVTLSKRVIEENQSFRIHLLEGYISNIYLVEYDHAMLLLDSGSLGDAPKIIRYCEDVCSRPASHIALCAISHMHPDHAGGAACLRASHGVPLAAFHTIDRWYEGITGYIQYLLDCRMEQWVSKAIGKKREPVLFGRRLNPDHLLCDGQKLPLFPDWKVFHIPGHTLHDIALYHEKEKILHTGDSVLRVKGEYSLPIPVFFKGRMRSSFDRLSQLHPRLILPGHGDVIETSKPGSLFRHMRTLVDAPRNDMSRLAHTLSLFTPAVWKKSLKNIFRRRSCIS